VFPLPKASPAPKRRGPSRGEWISCPAHSQSCGRHGRLPLLAQTLPSSSHCSVFKEPGSQLAGAARKGGCRADHCFVAVLLSYLLSPPAGIRNLDLAASLPDPDAARPLKASPLPSTGTLILPHHRSGVNRKLPIRYASGGVSPPPPFPPGGHPRWRHGVHGEDRNELGGRVRRRIPPHLAGFSECAPISNC
jgi:hypothetical protein